MGLKKPLVIVEASGKVDHLQQMLRAIGLPAKVMATLGHIGCNPKELRPISLDADLRETAYRLNPDKERLLDNIRQAAFQADKVYLATDDDQEGDVIAFDLAHALSGFEDKLQRVRLRAISEVELQRAFAAAQPLDPQAAYHGICRRIVDRAIGATFSRFDEKAPIFTGRVQSSLLAQLDKAKPVIGTYVLEANIASGAKLRAVVPLYSMHDAKRLADIQRALDAGEGKVISVREADVALSTPWGYEQVVFESSMRLRIGIEEAAQAFQDAYERGKVSYPRTRANGSTAEGVDTINSLARHNRSVFDGSVLALREETVAGAFPHETPRPLDDEMQLGRSLAILDSPDAVAVLIARNMIECAQMVKVRQFQIAVADRQLSFETVPTPPMRSWKGGGKEKEPGAHPWTLEQSLLSFMAEYDLGRPSTVVPHVKKFLRRGLIVGVGEEPFRLSTKGEQWLQHALQVGFSPDTSRRMEERFASPVSDPSRVAREVLETHGFFDRVRDAIGAQSENVQENDVSSVEMSF